MGSIIDIQDAELEAELTEALRVLNGIIARRRRRKLAQAEREAKEARLSAIAAEGPFHRPPDVPGPTEADPA